MPRLLALLLGALAVAVLSLATLTVLAYGVGPGRAGEAAVPGLRAPVTVALDEDGSAVIEAGSEADLFAGLGYAHALRNAWPMALWRQAATGALSGWFTDSTSLALDVHTRQLGFGTDAQRAYAALPDSARALLDAYAAGVNAAFDANRLGRDDPFVLLGVLPEPWRPWDAFAVEGLLAYLGTPPPAPPPGASLEVGPGLQHFLDADAGLRAYLRVGGLQHGLAFAAAVDTAGTAFFQRIVSGSSALPLVQEAELRLGGRRVLAATVPGTLALPGGFAEDAAWAVLLAGTSSLDAVFGEAPPPSHDRVVRQDGREVLVEARRAPGALYIAQAGAVAPPPPPPLAGDTLAASPPLTQTPTPADTLAPPPPPAAEGWWVLRWRGFGAGTDLPAWRALLGGGEPTFALFGGGGLVMTRGGEARVLGQPAFVGSVPGGVVVGGAPEARFVAERLALADTLRPALDALGTDALSPWAARLAPPLVAALGPAEELPAELRDAAAFLGGWDARFDPDAIGAAVFEYWMRAYRGATGRFPQPDTLQLEPVTRTDTVLVRFADLVREETAAARVAGRRPPPIADSLEAFPERADSLVSLARTRTDDSPDLLLLKQALRQGLAQLREDAGATGADWRWGQVQRARLAFPARPDTARAPRLGARRFRPVALAEGGHPTAIAWGPSLLFLDDEPAGAWAAWTSTADWDRVRKRMRDPHHERLARRYAAEPEPAPTRTLARGRALDRPVRLVPAG